MTRLATHEFDDDLRLLVDLVSTPSVSGEERPAAEVFLRHARERGLATEVDEVGNALAHRGAGAGEAIVQIVLLGHIDTVPGHIPVRIESGILHGRGSVDAKGPLAAMLCAASRVDVPAGVRLSVIGAVGEETEGSPGARHLVDRLRPDACVIGEPSGWDGVTLGYKGRLVIAAETERSSAHSAGIAPSAADELFAWWQRVRAHVGQFNVGRERVFEQIQATIGGMNSSADGVAQRAGLRVGFRLPPGLDPEDLAAMVEALVDGRATLTFFGREVAYAGDRNDAVVRALCSALRDQGATPRPKRKTGTTDMNVVAPVWRCPIAAYGPGDSALDHTSDERLALEEYARSIDVLAAGIRILSHELLDSAGQRPSVVSGAETTS